jgi:hypothetical protein
MIMAPTAATTVKVRKVMEKEKDTRARARRVMEKEKDTRRVQRAMITMDTTTITNTTGNTILVVAVTGRSLAAISSSGHT